LHKSGSFQSDAAHSNNTVWCLQVNQSSKRQHLF